ncbi:MAG: helix-turn-helix domain-containing protein [Pseudonocardiaceae bacterium]
MDDDEAGTIGRRLRQVRKRRDKSLRVIAGLAGMKRMTLSRIERGERAVTLSELVALAGVLEIAPSELTALPVPAPANGHTDSTTEAVRLAVDAVEANHPGGLVLPVAVLRDQVARIHQHQRACRFTEVATDLPGLIRNLHTTLATGANHTELLDLAIYLHTLVTRLWLWHSSAPEDLIRRVVFVAQRLAQEGDKVSSLAVAEYSVADALIIGGALEPGRAKLDSLTLPPITAGTAGFVATATGCHAAAAVLAGRPGEATAPMEAAVEIAGQFEVDFLSPVPEPTDAGTDRFRFGSLDAATLRMWVAFETGEPDRAVSVAQDNIQPQRHPLQAQVRYWTYYGRALARLRGRHDDAVRALRRAEAIHPHRVQRDPFVREVLAELLTRTRRDSPAGRELRAMAYRAGVPE